MKFSWKFHCSWHSQKYIERHYKCQNTGAWKCCLFKEFNPITEECKAMNTTYALPQSTTYNIKSEQALMLLLINV